ncbi:MAG: microcin ABC transporter ATP-binding protein, partial [Halothiobacillus sp.]
MSVEPIPDVLSSDDLCPRLGSGQHDPHPDGGALLSIRDLTAHFTPGEAVLSAVSLDVLPGQR